MKNMFIELKRGLRQMYELRVYFAYFVNVGVLLNKVRAL